MFPDCRAAVAATGATVSLAMVPPNGVLAAVEDAVAAGIKLIVTVAEGVPVHDALRVGRVVRDAGATWVGASTPGLAIPGEMKLGFLPDVSLRPGPLAMMSKSGTLSYETGYRLGTVGLGTSIWVGVGGDPVKGVRFADLLPTFLADQRTRGIILVGEVGGNEEEEFADALARSPARKPVYALVAGRGAKEGVPMGHAGALMFGNVGTFESKKARLEAAGAQVFASIEDLDRRLPRGSTPDYFLSGRAQPDVQLAKLLLRNLRRRAHQQILGALVHREQHHLAQVLLAAQQHDDAVDAGRDAAVRRRAERQRAQHAAELLLQHVLRIAGDGERLLHHVGAMVADRAGRQLDAVADDVVLDRLQAEDGVVVLRVERQELLRLHVRHRERVVGEVDLLLLLAPFVHREVDDPAERELILLQRGSVPRRPWCAPDPRTSRSPSGCRRGRSRRRRRQA